MRPKLCATVHAQLPLPFHYPREKVRLQFQPPHQFAALPPQVAVKVHHHLPEVLEFTAVVVDLKAVHSVTIPVALVHKASFKAVLKEVPTGGLLDKVLEEIL